MRIREFFKRIKEFFIYLFSKENIFKVVAGAVAFAVSFTVIFLVTNGRKVEGKLPVKREEEVTTYFERFTGKMLDKLDNPEDSISTKITIDNLTLSYGDEETPASASLNGDMVFKANSRDDISFTVDLESSLFNLTNRLAFGYVNKNVYISNGKKGVKTSIETCKEAIEYLKQTVGSIELPFEVGGDLTETLMNLADSGLLGSIEPVETVYETYALVQISNETMDVSLQINKESYLLESLTINSIKLGDAEITGKVNLVGVTEIIPFDDFRYQRHMGTFKDGVVYLNWLKDVHDVFAREKLGLNMTTLVSDPDNDDQLVATINSKMNVNFNGGIDFSKSLFDILLEDDFTKLEMSAEFFIEMEESGEVIAAGITQFEQDGYVEIDSPETSLKAKIENDDMVFISDRISDLMGSLMQKEKKVSRSIVSDAQDYIQDIIDYLTSGEIIKAIRTLDLSSLGKMLKESDTVDGSSYVVLDLSNLGLGDSVNASFIVDNTLLKEGNISEISISNLVVGGMDFDCLITVNEFNETKIGEVKSHQTDYKQIDVSLLKYTLGTINANLLYTKGTISVRTPEGALFGLTISPEIYFTLKNGELSFFIDMGIDISGFARYRYDSSHDKIKGNNNWTWTFDCGRQGRDGCKSASRVQPGARFML